jgi:hypothetical protein
MFPYKSPELCSRCGSPDVAAIWKVTQKTGQFNLWAFLTSWFGLNIPRFASSTFDVPVCDKCGDQLVQIHKITKWITITLAALLGLISGLVFLVKGVHWSALVAGLIILILITLFSAMIGAFGGIIFGLAIQDALNYEFCSYDGQYYHFKNKKFRREFALLNPELIKQKKK